MKKILQILLGLFLILVLAYFSFLEVSSKIKDDLLLKAKTKLIDKGIVSVHAEIEGEGLFLSRTLILTGTLGSEKKKNIVVSLIEELNGVASVNNQILVKERHYTISSTPVIPVVKKVEAIVPVVEKAIKPVVIVEEIIKETPTEKVTQLKEEKVALPTVKEVIEPVVTVVPEVIINIPVVPVATQEIPTVPTVITIIEVPVAIEAEKAIVNEEHKNIEIQGVK